MDVSCIDLKLHFGGRLRVIHDDSYLADHGKHGRVCDPWLQLIPCRNGHIYPHGGVLLGASTNNRGPIARALAALPGVLVVQDGNDGINVVFPVVEFEAVAAILKPRRRRILSPERAAELTERLRRYRFTAADQNAGAGQGCDPSPARLPEAA
jgi:hypothetical protein